MARNLKISATWFDPDTDDEWEITATYNVPRPGTYYDPPEGGDFEDVLFVHDDDELDESDFLERFGQRQLDHAMDALVAAIKDENDEDEPDDIDDPDFSDIDDVLE